MKYDRSAVMITVPGATDEALDRAMDCALEVLFVADVTPQDAQLAVDARDAWNYPGGPLSIPSMAQLQAAAAFDLAKHAAFYSCKGGPPWPSEISLFMIRFRTPGAVHWRE